MNEPIKIGFVGFHPSFKAQDYSIVRLLRNHFSLDIVDTSAGEVPDFLFFSVYNYPHRDTRYDRCHKIFTSEENIRIPWTECDCAVTGDHITDADNRHLRLPIYIKTLMECPNHPLQSLVKPPRNSSEIEKIFRSKTQFCNFIVSNPYSRPRLKFYEILSKYKKVDSGGKVLNNLGGCVVDKLSFLNEYKFTIAFENSRHPGYVTEKIVESMLSNSIPIYWGDRQVLVDEINPQSIVDANEPEDCQSLERHFEQIVEEIVRLDQDDDSYLDKMAEPWLLDNRPSPYLTSNCAPNFFRQIFATPREDLGTKKTLGAPRNWEELEGRDWMLPSYWENQK